MCWHLVANTGLSNKHGEANTDRGEGNGREVVSVDHEQRRDLRKEVSLVMKDVDMGVRPRAAYQGKERWSNCTGLWENGVEQMARRLITHVPPHTACLDPGMVYEDMRWILEIWSIQ